MRVIVWAEDIGQSPAGGKDQQIRISRERPERAVGGLSLR
jgi:hypothetical protein